MKKSIAVYAFALLWLGINVQADVFNMPTGLKSLETVAVDNPGNKADDTGFGAVTYPFKIGKFEVTAAQYVEFLNAKAKKDIHGLYHLHMAEAGKAQCKIERNGKKGAYTYSVISEYANRPVDWVSFWSACRFCNWLHNGQGDGDTETGAYTLNGSDGREIKRNPDAKWFVPSEDEWYKAAYYDADKAGGAGYWDYPTRSDSKPNRDYAGSNAANYYDGSYLDPVNYLTQVGAFANSKSGYGTFDQGGNVSEWNEAIKPPFFRSFRGGSFGNDGGSNIPDALIPQKASHFAGDIVGFRIAGALPGVATGVDSKSVCKTTVSLGQGQFPRRPWLHPQTGKPYFPLGWYEWESLVFTGDKLDRWNGQVVARSGRESLIMATASLDEMAHEGANTVVFINKWLGGMAMRKTPKLFQESIDLMNAYLDHAEKRNIKVLVLLGAQAFYEAKTDDESATMLKNTRKLVESIGKHPALLGYQVYDEPEYYSSGDKEEDISARKKLVDALLKLRDYIRDWDKNKNHTIQVVFNVVPYTGGDCSDWRHFLPTADSFQIDRYPIGSSSTYLAAHEWGPLAMAWSIAHGVATIQTTNHRNPSPVLQAVGLGYFESGYWWRDPLYDETRYMAYSSMTVGCWGIIHWIRNPSSKNVRSNVARLYKELRQLMPALENSWEQPPFTVSHNHEGITRSFLTDCISDISTLPLEDKNNYYLVASDNSGTFDDVSFRMKLPNIKDTKTRKASVLNEDWSRDVTYDSATGEWVITKHKMCFGDVNIWVISK